MKYKQHLSILFFVIICAGLSSYSLFGRFDGEEYGDVDDIKSAPREYDDSSIFKHIDYYLFSQGDKFITINSTELVLYNDNTQLDATSPKGIFFRQGIEDTSKKEIHFEAKESKAFIGSKELKLNEDVVVRLGTSSLKSKTLDIFKAGKLIEASGNVKTQTKDQKTQDQINIQSNFVSFKPDEDFFEYKGNVVGELSRKRKYEQGINFSSDKISLLGNKGLLELDGKVKITRQNLKAEANKGTVYIENYNKRLKYYSLSDDVRLEENFVVKGKSQQRKALAEKLESITSEETIILTGLPKVFQGRDVIRGNRIIIRENVETVEVDDANTNIIINRE